jgi:ABC-2 type transport system permease protein
MSAFGVSQDYSTFMIAGFCATAGFFEIYPSVVSWVSDIEGDQVIAYYLTLPIPAWLVFLRMVVFFAISAGTLSSIVLPVCKVLAWNRFDMSMFCIAQFIAIFITMNIFFGAFTLVTTSFVQNMASLGNVWMRFVYPVWFLGGFQYAWFTLYKAWPSISYLALLNPMTYIMEAIRVSILGQEGYLPFWLCTAMTLFFALVCTIIGIKRLKKRLDFV